MNDPVHAIPGSSNIFADLGFENAEEELLKAKLVRELRASMKRWRLTEAKAAELMGMQQADISAIVRGRTGRYSCNELAGCCARLGHLAEFVVAKKPRPAGWKARP